MANDKEEYVEIIPFDIIANEDKKLNSAKWMLATINNSISDNTMHYSVEDLYEIFNNANISKQYHYAILTLFKEVEYSDVINYCELFNIKKSNLKKVYTFYKNEFKKEGIKQYEWLLEEL